MNQKEQKDPHRHEPSEASEDTGAPPVLEVSQLRVAFAAAAQPALAPLSFTLNAGETLAIVGESGSGKTLTAKAIMGLLPSTAKASGAIRLRSGERWSENLTRLREGQMKDLRGKRVSMVFQEPMSALNPSMKVGDQIAEVLRNHTSQSRAQARQNAVELLEKVGIVNAARQARAYPHELSGGQRQRVVIAIALACEPAVIIADEPTTALDVRVQAEILRLLREIVKERGTALLLISHNMGVVATLADHVLVMKSGEALEYGSATQVLTKPTHSYTRALLAAVPRLSVGEVGPQPEPDQNAQAQGRQPLLRLSEVSVDYSRFGHKVRAVDEVSLEVLPGEILGLVGESGSGKSTLGRVPLGLVRPASGRVEFLGRDMQSLPARSARALRKYLGVMFQDPAGSLDPRMSIAESICEPLKMQARRGGGVMSAPERRRRVRELLEAVRLPGEMAKRYPHELSGGQRQRVGLARALALSPKLLIADEPTSALDVSVQAEVLALIADLQKELGFGALFISHDLAVVNSLCERVVVMRNGKVVESGLSAQVLHHPDSAYTRALLDSLPSLEPASAK